MCLPEEHFLLVQKTFGVRAALITYEVYTATTSAKYISYCAKRKGKLPYSKLTLKFMKKHYGSPVLFFNITEEDIAESKRIIRLLYEYSVHTALVDDTTSFYDFCKEI